MTRDNKRECSVSCASECCYFTKFRHELSKSQIREIKRAAKSGLEIKPEYRDFVRSITENEGFVDVDGYGEKYLRVDKSKPGIAGVLSTLYYPCVFLGNAEYTARKDKFCKIYAVRFDFCRNTTTNDCLPGISKGRK